MNFALQPNWIYGVDNNARKAIIVNMSTPSDKRLATVTFITKLFYSTRRPKILTGSVT